MDNPDGDNGGIGITNSTLNMVHGNLVRMIA